MREAMSSTDVGVGSPHDRIQEIINSISDLSNRLEREADGAVSPQQQQPTPTAAADHESNKKNEEVSKRKQVERDLEKLCKELKYMISSLVKLQKFEIDLQEPLQTLKANVDDILKDLPRVTDKELPKQVSLNLQVLRNNITRIKIQIPLQHHAAKANAEAKRPWQTTVATTEADDLPHLYDEEIFESSYYFKEVEAKYKELDDREKLCLLCFAIFPENAEIKKRLLRFWWVGENLLVNLQDDDEMEVLSTTLDKFVEMGLVQPVQKKNKLQPRSYKMNPIVRSCLIKFAKEARFFDYNSEGKPTMDFSNCNKACMVKSDEAPFEWFSKYLEGRTEKEKEKEKEKNRLPADLVKLQMLFNFPDKDTLESTSKQFDKLQTLFNISKQFPALPKEWFLKMTGINVVYLGRWETKAGRHIEVEDIDFLRGFKNMKSLKLLSLQGISGIPTLPRAVCKLPSLRILDLRACHNLDKLPEEIGKLKSLTYLDVSECYLLDDLPKQIKKLGELQVLKGFVIGNDRNSCTLEDLSALEKLRKLSVNVNKPEFDIEEAGEALAMFKNLQKLKIAWGSGSLSENNSSELVPKGEESKAKEHEKKNAAKTQNQATATATQIAAAAAKPATDNNVNRAIASSGSNKPTNHADKEGQNVGTTNSVDSQVSDKYGIDSQAIGYMFGKRLRKMIQDKRPKEREGLGRLVKLDLQCFPDNKQPTWLVPGKLTGLKNLSIRGGNLSQLRPAQDATKESWKVETLRLKFLINLKMDWKTMLKQFKDLKYLENVRCPRITFCPCDANGVWQRH